MPKGLDRSKKTNGGDTGEEREAVTRKGSVKLERRARETRNWVRSERSGINTSGRGGKVGGGGNDDPLRRPAA